MAVVDVRKVDKQGRCCTCMSKHDIYVKFITSSKLWKTKPN